ncbi:MAG: AraC family transcriptional regulator [Bifidobacterium pseudolongum subsp. globosum]|nr:AraC family transcriptional regulator [Bifidobacterium pseudolongum subsp. globosum]
MASNHPWERTFLKPPSRNETQGESLRIDEIAFSIGFVDVNTFRNNFKREVGTSPSRYRKSMNGRGTP